MQSILSKIAELVKIYRAVVELRAILDSATPELKADIKALAEDIDSVISKVVASPNDLDDKLVPVLTTISTWLKKISA